MQIRTMSPLVIFMVVLSLAAGFQNQPCENTPACQCKWSEGKRMADCSNQGLQSIPTTLAPEIQTLILDGNPLRKLDKDAFKTVGLLNVQTLSLRHCRIEYLDDNAFRDLRILTHLDLGYNNITKLFPKTFDGNNGLKTVKVSHNPIVKLVSYQFPPLRSLKTIDLSNCNLAEIDRTSFKNLGASVESVLIDNNQLQTLREEVFVSLINLKALTLHSNPWTCDCKLKNFRDFVVNKKLYNRPTMCSEPSRLYKKKWDEITAAQFACKPELHVPFGRVFGAPGVDAMLSCHIMGSPVPSTRWVRNGRIINNNTHPAPLADQTYILHKQRLTFDSVESWFNVTITNPSLDDLGEYICVAENNGGVMERTVLLTFDDPSAFAGGIPISDEEMTIIVGASVAVLVLLLLLLCLCCYCFCRKRGKKKSADKVKNGSSAADNQKLLSPQQQQVNMSGHNHNNTMISNGMGNGGTLPKARSHHHHIDYHGLPQNEPNHTHSHSHHQLLSYIPGDKYELEMQDMRQHQMRAPSVISNSNKTSNSTGSNGSDGGRTTASISRASFVDDPAHAHLAAAMGPSYPPDLLVIKPSMSPSMHQLSPAGLIQFTPVTSSPFTRSGTLPLPQHRSLSCDHSNSSSPIPHMIHQHPLPVIHHHHHHPSAPRGQPGYVTLPRRPRASWSVPREQPSPSSASLRSDREPIYDGIGPRTSADGSSRLNITKAQHGTPPQPQQRFALPPYYAPIEELAECPPTPKVQQSRMQNGLPKSTPNILDLKNSLPGGLPPLKSGLKQHKPVLNDLATSSSETTLLEENMSGYCEPFGKSFMPKEGEEAASKAASKAGNRNSITSAESELDLVVPVKKGKKSNGVSTSTPLRQNGKNGVMKPPADVKRAPKTLPKPKVKPVPPPKPKKSFGENGGGNDSSSCTAPLIAFQDESVEGSEV